MYVESPTKVDNFFMTFKVIRWVTLSFKKDCTCWVLYVNDSMWRLWRGFAYATILHIKKKYYKLLLL
jgi:hypothetical protein